MFYYSTSLWIWCTIAHQLSFPYLYDVPVNLTYSFFFFFCLCIVSYYSSFLWIWCTIEHQLSFSLPIWCRSKHMTSLFYFLPCSPFPSPFASITLPARWTQCSELVYSFLHFSQIRGLLTRESADWRRHGSRDAWPPGAAAGSAPCYSGESGCVWKRHTVNYCRDTALLPLWATRKAHPGICSKRLSDAFCTVCSRTRFAPAWNGDVFAEHVKEGEKAQQWRILIPGSPDLDKGIQETPRLLGALCLLF